MPGEMQGDHEVGRKVSFITDFVSLGGAGVELVAPRTFLFLGGGSLQTQNTDFLTTLALH